MDLSQLQRLLDRAAATHLICIGDLMVDRYVYGEVVRISPEAPIPVLSRSDEKVMLGAVGNVARNVAAFAARVVLIGVVGEDDEARSARQLLEAEPNVIDALATEPGRRTTVKTRFVSSGQQLLRVDAEDDRAIHADTDRQLIAALEKAVGTAGAVLVSDYAKGAVSPAVIAACLRVARRSGAAIAVDPKGHSFAKYGAVDLIKPNAKELGLTTGLPTRTDAEIEAALVAALSACDAKAILVTRAGHGMSLLVRGSKDVRHFRAPARTVFDVSGAGDTTLAALGVALASGAPLADAVELALLASGVVVGKAGTAVVTPAELIEAEFAGRLAPAEAKLATLDRAVAEVARWRAAGLKVGFTNGCFDILHRGHVAYLDQARAWCDRLVVGLNSDASVRALKGETRPVNSLESRALVLAGLSAVDLVAPFDDDTPRVLIEALRPDVLVKGADYTVSQVVGADLVQSYGGEVRLADIVDGYSTTKAIARMSGGDAAAKDRPQ
ncbi:MAG: D-glycero-beta-D-manno-heptose 1-phosphate adenylyltransferase [Caulobacteraceae bacterium]